MDNKPKDDWDTPARLAYKRKERLFQSLQEHTQGEVDWQLLKDWKQAREGIINDNKKLYTETREMITNIISQREYTDVKIAMEEQLKGEVSIDILTDRMVELIWREILTDKQYEIHIFTGTSLINKGKVELRFKQNSDGLRIDNRDLARKLLSASKWALKNLRTDKSDTIASFRNEVNIMRARYNDLEDLLNELVLRPIILKTRCKLCPA
jgi:hypothetical protein